MNIICFGIARDIIQGSDFQIATEEAPKSVSELRTWLAVNYPAFSELKHYMIAINQEYGQEDSLLKPTDEIVIIPPVSGG